MTQAAPSRWIALLAAAAWLTLISPVLAVLSFLAVVVAVNNLLVREEVCVTYACGDGAAWVLIFFSLGWMCVMWLAGVVAALIAVRRTVTVGRALVAATLTAVAVAAIAVAVDWGWVIWSV